MSRERSKLSASVEAVQTIEKELKDAIEFAELGDLEGDESLIEEAREMLKKLKTRTDRAELEALLSGEADGNDAYLEINSGAGGTESNDWAGILLRMYTRWAAAHGMTVEVEEETVGEQAGIKSVTLQIKGENAYGWLKTRRACTGWCGFRRSIPMRGGIRHLLRCGSIRLSMTPLSSISIRRMCGPIPIALRVPAVSTSTRRIRPCV